MKNRLNVLFIVMDAFRYKNLNLYGYPKLTAPNLELLANDGVVFENTISVGNPSPPAAGCLLSGMHVVNHKYRGVRKQFDAGIKILPDFFKAAGYDTCAVVANPLFHSGTTFNQFDRMWDIDQIRETIPDIEKIHLANSNYKHYLPRAEDVTSIACDQLKQAGDKPFCMFLWYMDTHENFHLHYPIEDPIYEGENFAIGYPADGYNFMNYDLDLYRTMPQKIEQIKHEINMAYDGEVKYFDSYLGNIIETLKEKGVYENTVIAVVGDHGTAVAEHGFLGHRYANLYEEVIRIPLILHAPGLNKGRKREIVRNIDLLPTILDYCGIARSEAMDGISLKPLLTNEGDFHPIPSAIEFIWPVTSRAHEIVLGWRDYPWKFFKDMRDGGGEYLYNLEWDPHETNNLRHRADCLEIAEKMRTTLSHHFIDNGEVSPLEDYQAFLSKVSEEKLSASEEEMLNSRLQALGYIE